MKSVLYTIVLFFVFSCAAEREIKNSSYVAYQNKFYHALALRPHLRNIKEPQGKLTLKRALALALIKSPSVRFSLLQVKSKNAIALQEGLYANPEFDFEMENFAGGGQSQGLSALEVTFKLSQLFELGGKPSKRRRVAQFETRTAVWNLILSKIETVYKTTASFLKVLFFQERVKLEKQRVLLTRKIYDLVSMRVKVGQISAIELYRARSALLRSRFELKRSQQKLRFFRNKLSAAWGSEMPRFTEVVADFYSLRPILDKNKIVKYIKRNPKLRSLNNELKKQKAVLVLAKTGRVPDLKVSGGFRYSRETGTGSFLLGLSIPLPLFNSNQGKIKEARLRIQQASVKRNRIILQMKTRFSAMYQKLQQAYKESNTIKKVMLPNVNKTYQAILDSYKEGKHDLFSVLDSRRKLFEMKELYLESLIAYHVAVLELERLMGFPLSIIRKKSMEK